MFNILTINLNYNQWINECMLKANMLPIEHTFITCKSFGILNGYFSFIFDNNSNDFIKYNNQLVIYIRSIEVKVSMQI